MTTNLSRRACRALIAGLVLAGSMTAGTAPAMADDPIVEIAGGQQSIAVARDEASGNYWLRLPGQASRTDTPATLRLGNERRRLLLDYPAFAWVGPGDEMGWITALASEGADPLSTTFTSAALDGQLNAAAPRVDLRLADFKGPGTYQWYETDRARGRGSQEVPPNPRSSSFRLGTGTQRDGTPQTRNASQDGPGNVNELVQRFNASGMYCLTFEVSYTPTGQIAPETISNTLRVAVGDSVRLDAPCGTPATEPEWARPYVGEVTDGGVAISANTDPSNGRDFLSMPGMPNYWRSPATLRLRNDQRRVLPEDEAYAWVGRAGAVAWQTLPAGTSQGLHLQFDANVSGELLDDTLQVELRNVAGPGDYQTYLTGRPDAPDSIVPPREDSPFKIGTGEQRDGVAQERTGSVLIEHGSGRHNFNVHRFTASGMYCITYDVSFTVIRDGEPISRTLSDTLRVAVGDSVPVDAPCGTASEEPPYAGPGGPDPDGPAVIRAGHGDLIYPEVDAAEDGQRLALRAHHDDYGTLDWDDLVVSIPDVQKTTLPQTYTPQADYSFIGPAGSTVWNSPEVNAQAGPWIGMATQSPSLLPLGRDHRFSIRLDAVTGPDGTAAPGQVALWRGGSAAAATATGIMWSTRKGLPDSYSYLNNLHSHFNWSFTHSGVYCLAFAVVTDLPDGARHEAKEQLTLAVGSAIDPAAVTPCGRDSSYPTPAPRETLPPVGEAPYVVTGGSANLTAAIDEPAPGSPDLATTLDLDDAYGVGPATRHAIDDVILHSEAGYRSQPYQIFQRSLREHGINLAWSTVDIPAEGIDGTIEWELTVRGPGEITIDVEGRQAGSTGEENTLSFPSRAKSDAARWTVTRPGKYCVAMKWTAKTPGGHTVTDQDVLTVVADGPLDPNDGHTISGAGPGDPSYGYDGPVWRAAEHGALAKTCAQDPDSWTRPSEVPLPDGSGDPDPGTPVWDVPNWAQTDSGATILNLGHVDIASLLDGNTLITRVKDSTAEGVEHATEDGASWHELDDVVFQLLPGSEMAVPSDLRYAFLGTPGTPMWQVGQQQDLELLWPGWSAETIRPADLRGGALSWTLKRAEGPGNVLLWQTDSFGHPIHIFNSKDGLPDTTSIAAGAHVHANWTFTQEGVYCLKFARTGTLTAGTAVSDEFTLAVAVGRTDPRKVDPAHCVATEREPDPGEQPGPGDEDPGPGQQQDPGVQPGPGEQPGPIIQPGPDPQPKPVVKAASIRPLKAQTVNGKRLARLATLRCPAGGSCKVTVPKRVRVRIAGKRHTLSVLVPKTIRAGKTATLRVRLPKAAASRLQGRKVTVKVKVAVVHQGKKTTRTVKVTIKANKPARRAATGRTAGVA